MRVVRWGTYRLEGLIQATCYIKETRLGYYLSITWADATGTLEGPYNEIWQAKIAAYDYLKLPHHRPEVIEWE